MIFIFKVENNHGLLGRIILKIKNYYGKEESKEEGKEIKERKEEIAL